jgi:hypothetical protein
VNIGELAQATNTKAEAIRYYERIGLLPAPPRTAGNYRDYSPANVSRLTFTRALAPAHPRPVSPYLTASGTNPTPLHALDRFRNCADWIAIFLNSCAISGPHIISWP